MTRPASLSTFRCWDTAGRLTGSRCSQLADGERAVREVLHDRPTSAIAEDAPFVVQLVSLHER